MKKELKLGVRLYSFRGLYPMEDSFKLLKDMGIDAYDITAAMVVPYYPWPPKEYIKKVRDLNEKYEMNIIEYASNSDIGIRKDRKLTDDEMIFQMTNMLYYAALFGAKVMRMQWSVSPKVIEGVATAAEKLKVKTGFELHAPLYPTAPIVEEYMKTIRRIDSPYIGIVPDFSAWAKKPTINVIEDGVRRGVKREIMEFIYNSLSSGVPQKEVYQKLVDEYKADTLALDTWGGIIGRVGESNLADFDGFKELMPYFIHVHGKTWDVDEDGNDPCIPVDKLLPMLRDGGYDGYIAIEYEGHEWSDIAPEYVVKKQTELYRRIWNS